MNARTMMNKIQEALDILDDVYTEAEDKYIREDVANVMDNLQAIGMSIEMGEEEEEIQRLKDEKNGVYPGEWDISN